MNDIERIDWWTKELDKLMLDVKERMQRDLLLYGEVILDMKYLNEIFEKHLFNINEKNA